jgi:hypothetical protein
MPEPVLALECFDSLGTYAVTVNGIDIVHINIDPETQTARVVTWGDHLGYVASDITVRIHPDAFEESA